MNETDEQRFERVASTWDRRASLPPQYNTKRIHHGDGIYFSSLGFFYQRLFDALPAIPAGSAFEVGCGSGQNLIYLTTNGAIRAGVGIDISAGSIQAADMQAEHWQARGLDFIHTDFDGYMAAHGGVRYDLVLAMQVVKHFPDLDQFFANVRQVMGPRSLFLLSDGRSQPPSLVNRLMSKLKANPTLRRAFRKGPRTPEKPDLYEHTWEDLVQSAGRSGLHYERGEYGFHRMARLINPVLYRWSTTEYESPLIRRLVKMSYLGLTRMCVWEDRLFSASSKGLRYAMVFRLKP